MDAGRTVTWQNALAGLAEGNLLVRPREVHMEIMEAATRQVWCCVDPLTRAEAAALDPGEGFVTVGVGESPMDLVGFRRSPGMASDGPVARRTFDGRAFLHVAAPASTPAHPFGPAGPMSLVVSKYQTVGFETGHTLWVLGGPDGLEYVQQTGGVPDLAQINLPEAFTLRSVELASRLAIEMQDEGPQTWWFPALVSFQGPVEGLPR